MKFAIVSIFFATIAAPASACSPAHPDTFAHTPQRVKEMYDSFATVVLATVSDVRKVKVTCGGIDFPMEAEQVTFRIDRAFKGPYPRGKAVVLTSASFCARSVEYSSAFLAPGAKREKLPRQWLLYMDNPAETEITNSVQTRTIGHAYYDIPILEQLSRGRQPRATANQPPTDAKFTRNCVTVK